MRIKLDRTFILELYCRTYQAERSIHHVLGKDWSELLAYYQGDRLDGLRSAAQRLGECLRRHGIPLLSDREKERQRAVPPRGLVGEFLMYGIYRPLFGRWLARWWKSWSFSDRELAFMALTWNDLVLVLETTARPAQDDLIALRMDLCACRSTIEDRCEGMVEIKRAGQIEHFWHADWLPTVKLADLLENQHREQHLSRKSA
jgi:hypothetical protein